MIDQQGKIELGTEEKVVDLRAMRGIVPSLNTPFDTDLSLDLDGLRREVEHVIAAGSAGLLAMAVAGEGLSLSDAEFADAAAALVSVNGGRIPLIASVSAADFDTSRNRARLAKMAGVDALLYQAPCRCEIFELKDRLDVLAEAGPGPIMLQDLDWSGPGLPIDGIASLFESVPAFQSLKIETVPAGPKYSQVLAATGGRLHVCGGWAVSQMLDALDRGVHAFMPTEFEEVYVVIYRLFAAGEEPAARELFEALLPFLAFSNQHIDVSIRFFKALRQEAGLFATAECRPPVPLLDKFHLAEANRLAALQPALLSKARDMCAEYLG